ncbi:MAG: L,D-transpeptidase family protein [Oscillospiraceae bacterium]|nr:L,D-transpeptidase family protein [Oscillospiraceae bacterium]
MKKKLISLLMTVAVLLSATTAFAENPTEAPDVTASPETVSAEPTGTPSISPTTEPTEEPTEKSAEEPTEEPTEEPSPDPDFEKEIKYLYDGVLLGLYPPARLIDGVTMIPIEHVAEYIGMTAVYDPDWNVEIVSLGDDCIYFNVDTEYTTAFGTDLNATHKTEIIDGMVYVSLRTFSEILGSELYITDDYYSLTIDMTGSPIVKNYFDSIPVNQWGISSRTNYLVWVSKSEYKVRVYKGSQYKWQLVREAPCAIGAPGTPTITGSFEYQYKTQWDYGTYYVGPCLVFYGGYALHSVLLRYDNTEYDGRTGVQISHGCIRLKKWDIDWIANTIPRYTRIYITD